MRMQYSLQIKTHLLPQHLRQLGELAPFDQEGRHLGDLAEGVVRAQRPFEVARAAGAACPCADSDHAPHHRKVTVTPVREQFVYF